MSKSPRPRSGKSESAPARSNRARQLSELVPDVGRKAFHRFGFVQSSIITRWREIVGDRYADVSTPEALRFPVGERSGGVLHLLVSSAHAAMMQHITPEIIERVNRFFGYAAVARVQFRQGAIPRRPQRAVPAPAGEVPQELGDSLRGIADPELKAVLESLAAGIAAPVPVVGKVR